MKKVISVILALVLVLALGTAAFADSGIVITKNPVSENRLVGETACFEAAAQNYKTLEWTFVNCTGHEYSVKDVRSMFPYVTVKDEDTASLKVCNLNTNLSGWSVYCTFRSNNTSAKTDPAYIYVSPIQYSTSTSSVKTVPSTVYTYTPGYVYGYVDEDLYEVDGFDPYAYAYVEEELYDFDGFDPYAYSYVEEDLYDFDGVDPSVFETDDDGYELDYAEVDLYDDDFDFIDFD